MSVSMGWSIGGNRIQFRLVFLFLHFQSVNKEEKGFTLCCCYGDFFNPPTFSARRHLPHIPTNFSHHLLCSLATYSTVPMATFHVSSPTYFYSATFRLRTFLIVRQRFLTWQCRSSGKPFQLNYSQRKNIVHQNCSQRTVLHFVNI